MKLRRLGSPGRFHEFDDEECAWCEAARRYFERNADLPEGETLHLENERGGRRTLTLTSSDPMTLECEPYVFFRNDD